MNPEQQLQLIASFLIDPTLSPAEKRAAIGIILAPRAPSNEAIATLNEVIDRALSDGARFDPAIPIDEEEALMRAQYIIQSNERRQAGLSSEAQEDFYFIQHTQASAQRQFARAQEDALVAEHGPVLSWNHLDIASTHRPDHVRAHGKNYNALTGARSVEGNRPGAAYNCDCVAGPPRQGVALLA